MQSVYPLIINSTNLVPDQFNNRYRYTFPSGSVVFQDATCAIASCALYYSWFNVRTDLGNNKYSFTFPRASGLVTYTVTMPDGYYSVGDINTYLQQFCISNGLYLTDSNGDNVYYIQWTENPTYYAVQLSVFPVPTSLPAGWTAPGSWSFPVASTCPRVTVPDGGLTTLTGFSAGVYPAAPTASASSFLSTSTPQISDVSSVIVSCTLANNRFNVPSNVVYSFGTANKSIGQLIEASPNEYFWVPVQSGHFTEFDVQFLDQNLKPLQIRDTNLTLIILIKTNV